MNSFLDEKLLQKIESLLLLSRRAVRGERIGHHLSYRKGTSLEFFDYRDYRQGDDFRYIDLHILRRLNRPVIKLFESEEELCIHIFIDTSASMSYGNPAKFEYARQIAAAIGYIGISQLDRVKIIPVTYKAHSGITTGQQRGNSAPLFRFLETLSPEGRTDLSRALVSYAARTSRAGLAVILSDLLCENGIQDGLNALLYAGFDLLVIQMLDQDELDPHIRGAASLIDMETGESISLLGDTEKMRAYKKTIEAHLSETESFCIERGIEYMRTTTSVPLENLLFEYLKRGAHLK